MRELHHASLLPISAALATLFLAAAARAETRTVFVDGSRPSGGDGLSWSSAFNNLQNALDSLGPITPEQAPSLDVVVRIAGGTYRGLPEYAAAFWCPVSLTRVRSLTLTGGYAGAASQTPFARNLLATPTTLSADALGNDGASLQSRVDNCRTVLEFTIFDWPDHPTAQSLEIDGVNFEGGQLDNGPHTFQVGSAVYGVNPASIGGEATVRFVDCAFRHNRGQGPVVALGAGGVAFSPCAASFERCVFEDNECRTVPAAIRISSSFTTEVTDCRFSNNRAMAIETDGPLTMLRCRVQGNYGGVYSSADRSSVSHCLFTHNLSTALFLKDLSTISHCTIVENSGYFGGGVFVDGRVAIERCIIVDNIATQQGNQIAGNWTAPNLQTSIVSNGENDLYFPFDMDTPRTPQPFDVAFRDPDGPDNDHATWQDNDYHLAPRSQAIDAGSVLAVGTRDVDGRLVYVEGIIGRGPRADLGCFEAQQHLCPADIDADGGVTIDDLLDFLVAFEDGQPLADLTTNGTTPFPDGGVTVDDLLFFLAKFEQGC